MSLLNPSKYCRTCQSAERYAYGASLGPATQRFQTAVRLSYAAARSSCRRGIETYSRDAKGPICVSTVQEPE